MHWFWKLTLLFGFVCVSCKQTTSRSKLENKIWSSSLLACMLRIFHCIMFVISDLEMCLEVYSTSISRFAYLLEIPNLGGLLIVGFFFGLWRPPGGLPCGAAKPAAFCEGDVLDGCLLYTSPSPRDRTRSRMPSSA